MAVTFNDIKKTKIPKNGEREKEVSSVEIFEDKKGRTLRPWETYGVKEEKRDLDLLDEINNRLDCEKQPTRKKRLVKKDFVKIPSLTEEEKMERKKKLEEKRGMDLFDEINNRLDCEKQPTRKKRLVKNDFVKIPPLTEEEKMEKKKKLEERMVSLEENKKKGITIDLEKKLKKVKQNYFDTL
jgi:hypothetical protein